VYSGMPNGHYILGIFQLSYVSLLEHLTEPPREKRIPLCYSFDPLIHGSYGKLTIHGQKRAFYKCALEIEQF